MTDSLITRLKALTGPDRKIDVEIYKALVEPLAEPFKEYVGSVWTGANSSIRVPFYTASIDAAMALVPKGWFVVIFNETPHHHWFCALHNNDIAKQVHSSFPFEKGGTITTPAIALLIAIMKAKEAEKQETDETP